MAEKNTDLVQNIKQNPLSWMVQAVGVVILLLNLYLASKLAPLEQGIVANAQDIEDIKQDTTLILEQRNGFVTNAELGNTISRLDRIEDKLDRLIESR